MNGNNVNFSVGDTVKILPNKGTGKITKIDRGFIILDNRESRPFLPFQLELIKTLAHTKYLVFEWEKKENKKTIDVKVLSRSNLTLLGTIKWYAPWRKYCFFTVEEYEVVLDSSCLNEINIIIKELMDERKGESKWVENH